MKLSIITINKNNAAGLERTIQSVVCQTFTDFEYIIIDGASDDTSVQAIKNHMDQITFWVSEPDSGIYNAMNKGIRKAQGDYCLFLNSGDCLISPVTLQNVFEEIDCSADIYYSDVVRSDNSFYFFPQYLDINFLISRPLNHQNTLIKKKLFIDHFFYNEKYRIVSDWEFLLQEMWIFKSSFSYIKTKIAIYERNGISSSNTLWRQKEEVMMYRTVFGDIAETIIELYKHRNTIYADILDHWGNTQILDFILKVYRFFIRRLR
jgi:glycosyltransferase involved in cell wall biosynthesis